jgi:PTH1 family peptidyl-tRNA hydrolase
MAKLIDWFKSRKHSRAEHSGERPLVVIGLGNPGERYAKTRHNVGFRGIDLLAERTGIRLNDRRKDTLLGQGTIAGKPVVLAKPRTFVNNSGMAARYLATRFGARPENIILLVDDLDLPVGRLRIRASGGSGGHNGLNSIGAELGTQDYPRVRLGIGRPQRTGAIDHVLGGFSEDEEQALSEALNRAADAVEAWVEHGIERAMNQFN